MIPNFFRKILKYFEVRNTLLERLDATLPTTKLTLASKPGFRGGPHTKSQQVQSMAVDDGSDYRTLYVLSSVHVPLHLLRRLKNSGAKIVLNQNGVYYPMWFKGNAASQNRYLSTVAKLSDFVFFQSEFAKKHFLKWVDPGFSGASMTLHNPIDTDFFCPGNRESNNDSILIFLDFSEFTSPVWDQVLTWWTTLGERSQNLDLILMGRVINPDTHQKVARKLDGSNRIKWYINQDQPEQVREVIRKAKVSLHLVYNDVCPNKVLEALACGVPVITVSAGGSAELVGPGGAIMDVAESDEKPSWPKPETIQKALEQILDRHSDYAAAARRQAERFSLFGWQQKTLEVLKSLEYTKPYH